MTTLDDLYRSLESGDVPLSVVADAYHDEGHPLAEGVRWLADEGRMPTHDGRSWRWYFVSHGDVFDRHADGLPHSVWDAALYRTTDASGTSIRGPYYPTLRAAIEAAAEAVLQSEPAAV